MSPLEAAGAWHPVGAARRVLALDVLRGFAIFGVLVANTLTFAYPTASAPTELAAWRGTGPADVATVFLVGLLVEGKFYTLLSVLFGMGLRLQSLRAGMAGRPFGAFAVRRLALLFVIGIVHGVFLYAGDILAFYALVGLAALPFRRLSRRGLAVAAFGCACLCVTTLTLYAWAHPVHPYPAAPNWTSLAADAHADAPLVADLAGRALETAGLSRTSFFRTMADETRTYRDGTWLAQTRLRAATSLAYALPSKVLLLGPMFLAFFLFGMLLVSTTTDRPDEESSLAFLVHPDAGAVSRHRTLCIAGITTGLVLVALGSGVRTALPQSPVAPAVYWAATFAGVFVQCVGYAAGMLLLCARRPDSTIVRSLGVVGRTALSNYIAQSMVLGVVFYGSGLGLFTQLTALWVVTLAVPILACEVWLSRLWLRRCTMGPLEWLWRSLSYGRRLALKRLT